MRNSISASAFVLACMALGIAGCGGEKAPEIGIVDGVVKIKGKPTSRIAVRFFPDPGQGNDLPMTASGVTDDNGKYSLHYVFKGQEGEGTAVGWHRVILEDTRLLSVVQGGPMPPRLFPVEYSRSTDTPLAFEVKPGSQTIDIEVK